MERRYMADTEIELFYHRGHREYQPWWHYDAASRGLRENDGGIM